MNPNKKLTPVVAQLKTTAPAAKRPVAPPAYRPQPTPKVLQTKRSPSAPQSVQTPRQPVAPPVYRPEAKKTIQQKAAPQRKLPTAAPVYRPEQKRIVQPKISPATRAHTPPQVPRVFSPPPKQVKSQHGRQNTIQPMLSSLASSVKESYYGLTEHEMTRVMNGLPIDLSGPLYDPIHGTFTVMNLCADLHVGMADPGQNVNKKFIAVLKKLKALMEYAADRHHLNVAMGKIELRPTGGVVVKQMVELLAFAGRGYFEQAELREKLEKYKKIRKQQVHQVNQKIAWIKQHRDERLKAESLDLVWKVKKQLPANHELSPGMAYLVSRAEAIRGEYQEDIDRLRSITGKRKGEFMGSAFFDEHFCLLQDLIGRGGHQDFAVSAFGLANDLPEGTPLPLAQQVAHNENALLLGNQAGHEARKVYIDRLHEKRASLRITIYYGSISEIISVLKMSS
jgi:hypothetical protein